MVPFFYDPPAPLSPAASGTVIRTEAISGAEGAHLERIMYYSKTPDGEDIAITGLFAMPKDAPAGARVPLVAAAHGTTGVIRSCAPSIEPVRKNCLRNPPQSFYEYFYKPWIDAGFAVVGTDYQGQGAPGKKSYLVGRAEGQNVLDSVRAARRLKGDRLSEKLILFGHSQGGNAAGYAAEISSEYAPELNVDGVVLGAPGALLWDLLEETYKTGDSPPVRPFEGITFLLLAGISYDATYPELNSGDLFLSSELAAELVPILGNVCAPVGGVPFAVNQRVVAEDPGESKNFPSSPSEIFIPLEQYPKDWRARIGENSLGRRPIDAPILILQGDCDRTIPAVSTVRYFNQICGSEDVTLLLEPGLNHFSLLQDSGVLSRMIAWATDVLEGASTAATACPQSEPAPAGATCSTKSDLLNCS